MGQHLLSIRILFHALFALVYLPIIGLGFTWGLSVENLQGGDMSFAQNHIDGITALSALVGLGIFAALDILTICRTVNQRAFLIIDIIVVVLMPLSMWPIIISAISVVLSNWFSALAETSCFASNTSPFVSWPGFCSYIFSADLLHTNGDEITSAYVVAATVAILALNAAFLLYICIAAVTDKVRGNNFLPIYPGDPSPSAPGALKNWYLSGNQRTPTERRAMTHHCADYIFRNSVFRKHAFEPTIWAIFRGIIAIYACVSLVVFSAYSALSEAQLRGTLTVSEKITMVAPYYLLRNSWGLSVASFLTAPKTPSDPTNFPMSLNPELNPPPTLSVNVTSGIFWHNPTPGFWTTEDGVDNFDVSWTGEYSLLMWVTSNGGGQSVFGCFNSSQVNSTNPLILAPFKQYTIVLIGISYILPDSAFTLWIPDFFTSVDSGSGSDASMASFSFNGYQQQVLVRDISTPSIFSLVAHVLSEIGGTLSVIDGLFAIVFGRTILAIIFGTRAVSPFGLLGMVTHNRFKRLIHEQYPRMQEDIEHGGMAAYISEVAIDAALIDKPSAKGHTGSAESSFMGDETGEGNAVGLRRMPGSSASYLRLPYIVEELGDLESARLVARKTDDE